MLTLSLLVKLHDVVIRGAADRALLATTSALDTSSHVATRNESRIAVSLVAQLADLVGALPPGTTRSELIVTLLLCTKSILRYSTLSLNLLLLTEQIASDLIDF